MKLVPKQVVVESSQKNFGLDSGRSEGSSFSVTFDVPPGLDGKDLKLAMMAEKKSLDLLVLTAEALKGAISGTQHAERKAFIEKAYERIVKSEQ